MRTLALLIALVASAHAEPGAGAQLHYELQSFHDVHDDAPSRGMAPPEGKHLVLAGVRLHAFLGSRTIGYHLGIDFAAGSTIDVGGLAYDVAFFPIGGALRFAQTSFITLGIGIGGSGALHTLDDAVTFPIEARLEWGRGIRVLGRVRATWVAAAKARHDGAVSAPFTDELEAMLGLRVGNGYWKFDYPTGNGYFVGATYREWMGAQFIGAIVGYSLDMGTPRNPPPR